MRIHDNNNHNNHNNNSKNACFYSKIKMPYEEKLRNYIAEHVVVKNVFENIREDYYKKANSYRISNFINEIFTGDNNFIAYQVFTYIRENISIKHIALIDNINFNWLIFGINKLCSKKTFKNIYDAKLLSSNKLFSSYEPLKSNKYVYINSLQNEINYSSRFASVSICYKTKVNICGQVSKRGMNIKLGTNDYTLINNWLNYIRNNDIPDEHINVKNYNYFINIYRELLDSIININNEGIKVYNRVKYLEKKINKYKKKIHYI